MADQKLSLATQVGRFRLLAYAEGISFLVILFVTMPLKYMMEIPGPNMVFGLIHGMLFVLYVLALLQIRSELGWNMKKTFLAFIAAIIPFGTFWADKKLFR